MERVIHCRECGAVIRMVKSSRGKTYPCEPEMVEFVPDTMGRDRYVTADGDVIRGCEPMDGDRDIETGWKDHRNGCPGRR